MPAPREHQPEISERWKGEGMKQITKNRLEPSSLPDRNRNVGEIVQHSAKRFGGRRIPVMLLTRLKMALGTLDFFSSCDCSTLLIRGCWMGMLLVVSAIAWVCALSKGIKNGGNKELFHGTEIFPCSWSNHNPVDHSSPTGTLFAHQQSDPIINKIEN